MGLFIIPTDSFIKKHYTHLLILTKSATFATTQTNYRHITMTKHHFKNLSTLLLIFLTTLSATAQELTVKSMSKTIDQTANLAENLHKDKNGEYGGLVKVHIAAPDIKFEGWILEQKKTNPSEYWVFMAKGSRRIMVYAEGYLPLEVYFRDYGINGIEPLHTYLLTIVLPKSFTSNVPTVSADISSMSSDDLNKLGEDHFNGTNSQTKDFSKAMKFFRQAANQGHARAQANLGMMYHLGLGVEKNSKEHNYAEALRLYRLAADQGDAKGQNGLGKMYSEGNGVKQDKMEALKWYQKAAAQKYIEAMNVLGDWYYSGQNVKQDYAEAVKWYMQAANLGDATAQVNLGWCYEEGYGVRKDYTEAAEWYRRAAEQGSARAQCDLGWCYYNGHGVIRDYTQAVKWYRKAAEQGYATAQCSLGRCYDEGYGVEKDATQAVEWYRKAAEQGDDRAQYCLGA